MGLLNKKGKGIRTTLLKNLWELMLFLSGQFLELVLRAIRFLIPMGLYTYLLQTKEKPTPTTALFTYLTTKSTFMFISPGVILVSVVGDEYITFTNKLHIWWKINHVTVETILQCMAYAIIIIYFLVRLIFG